MLNPPCLHYLEGCFLAMLQPSWHPENGAVMQWQARRDHHHHHDAAATTNTPPSTSNNQSAAHQGMSKTNRMLKLAGYVLHVIDLNIQTLPDTMPLPSTCNLAIFSSLLYLNIAGVPFQDIQHLPTLRKQLIELHVTRTNVPSLAALLGEGGGTWAALKVLELVDCGLSKLDPSLALAPCLHTLNVAHNDLQTLAHLENCPHLTLVNFSHNHLNSVAGAHRYLAAVAFLDLSHNHLASTSGLEKMFTLQRLDLTHNIVPTTGEVAYLVSLPLLHDLSLLGNPFVDVAYRGRVLELLGRGVVLDNTPWSPAELNLVDRLHPPAIDTVHVPLDAVDDRISPAKAHVPTSPFLYDLKTIWGEGDVVQDILRRTGVLCGLLMSKQLSFNTNQDDNDDLITTTEVASLDVLSTALEVLVESSADMPLHDFITMAGEIHKLLSFLGTLGGVALKPWVVDEASLLRLWAKVGNDSTVTVLHMVPVLLFVRTLCLEMEKSADATLLECVATAYTSTIAKQNKHAWLVQKAVLSTMQLSPVTRLDLLLMWDVEDVDQDAEFKEQRLHAIGRMLDILVVTTKIGRCDGVMIIVI
ncbi:hypothetical protein DYB37_011490 [Aphanomyces astaci]|uniref:Glycolipid transfer protein domain-containing protein n=1 Tax=Aphanomyces astaci TaxID=112090 RepID=A0A418DS42_APHAT|nr:hypothetical protein DYB35_011178 [Aphanomyces astaci]RHZ13844.1 hypothetical protein DYB37_011490 [Aphanomyces astaci]